jgi:hypothetical protein
MTSLTDLAEVVDVVIGVDTHVNTHSAAVVNAATGGVLGEITVEATPEGYEQLVEFADAHATLRAWAIEGTGGHGAGRPATWQVAKRSWSSSTAPSELRVATAPSPTPSMRSEQHGKRWRGHGSAPRAVAENAKPSRCSLLRAALPSRPPTRPSCRSSAW